MSDPIKFPVRAERQQFASIMAYSILQADGQEIGIVHCEEDAEFIVAAMNSHFRIAELEAKLHCNDATEAALDSLDKAASELIKYPPNFRPCAWEMALDLPDELRTVQSKLSAAEAKLERVREALDSDLSSVNVFGRIHDIVKELPNG